jgi:catechol 2,3-dioxygenase-like lactoylglutathione lyase family enzyme
MDGRLDHVVIWVDDPSRAVDFYQQVVGLDGVRVDEFRDGKAPFPSVRVSSESIIDLMARTGAAATDAFTGGDGSAGHPVNHVCLALDQADFAALQQRLNARDVAASAVMENSFGAQGHALKSFYFSDPDGNVIEVRCYP